jgi:hypothetical protein
MDPEPTKSQIPILLSAYQWHQLLRELEHSMRIVNRDQDILYGLYENISSQLNGNPVVVQRPEMPTEKPIESASEEIDPKKPRRYFLGL